MDIFMPLSRSHSITFDSISFRRATEHSIMWMEKAAEMSDHSDATVKEVTSYMCIMSNVIDDDLTTPPDNVPNRNVSVQVLAS